MNLLDDQEFLNKIAGEIARRTIYSPLDIKTTIVFTESIDKTIMAIEYGTVCGLSLAKAVCRIFKPRDDKD